MANSNLLKEAIADAKAVRETAIANAKIALEEAFTPKLQSILSQKLQAEMEDEEDADMTEEYGAEDVDADDSSQIGAGEGDTESGTDNAQPQDGEYQSATDAHTELDPETEEETAEVGQEPDDAEVVSEGEDEDEVSEEEDMEEGYHEEEDSEMEETYHEEDEDELDLAEIIAELEAELDDEEEMEEDVDDPMVGHEGDNPLAYNEEEDMEEGMDEEEEEVHSEMDMDEMDDMEDDEEEIDLDEILREMGYGDDEEDMEEGYHEEDDEDHSEMEAELEEAYSTIKELQSTINEVNLLNAKLLYTNKLFRSYNLNNEQKMKVVETLDRTGNVREVKLVYSTLAESFKYNTGGSVKRKPKTNITESFASKATASTAPKKEIISESNDLAERFKKLANIK